MNINIHQVNILIITVSFLSFYNFKHEIKRCLWIEKLLKSCVVYILKSTRENLHNHFTVFHKLFRQIQLLYFFISCFSLFWLGEKPLIVK